MSPSEKGHDACPRIGFLTGPMLTPPWGSISRKGMSKNSSKNKQTPLMQQYWDIKSAHMDKILLFRMGDFFEIFHEDAEVAAPILGIALTARNRKAQDETKMCGVPHHSIAGPINKLLSQGFKVAICDQIEDPRLAKGLVKRAVTRILTPGMVYDPDTLDHQRPNYMASEDGQAVSFLDTSTGEAFYFLSQEPKVRDRLYRVLQPSELVVSSEKQGDWLKKKRSSQEAHITGFDFKTDPKSNLPESAQRLRAYAQAMQGEDVEKTLNDFEERPLLNRLEVSSTVLRHLEVFTTYRGDSKGSLFHAMNRTCTSGGARLLKNWLSFPLAQKDLIESRQDQVSFWHQDYARLKLVRQRLNGIGDLQRRLGKVSHPNCNPQDMVSLADSLASGLKVSQLVEGQGSKLSADLQMAVTCVDEIREMIVAEPPGNIRSGNFINPGYHAELDEWIKLSGDSQKLLIELEAREKEATGITSLKVRYNNVFGYYIEVTNTHKDKVPEHYRRKQTLANAERYVTEELDELEKKVFVAKSRRLDLELELFQVLRKSILHASHALLNLATMWSEIDVYCGLAYLAHEQRYCRPEFLSDRRLKLSASRHPVVEQEVAAPFVANDIHLVEETCLLLTGPNMAGKSTIMRQVALTVLLAQIGSFVPAKSAQLPIYDRIFTRIGASDFLAEGLSTFMVEMTETAEMLNEVTSQSLVVLDEVGRGTSTYDGMSLAQSILEYLLVDCGCTILFATHYHELTTLKQDFPQICNAHMAIHEQKGEISFLHTLRPGPANKSYGIHVARLAGLPDKVTKRASLILTELEDDRHRLSAQMSLLGHDMVDEPLTISDMLNRNERVASRADHLPSLTDERIQLLEAIKEVSLPSLTPLEALNRIAEWQKSLS